ncbi:MAG: hypothetical protein C5S48_04180 [Candidatus Methanogaster sp.]|nr:MAG: hypothetical protein C5S48_04180 [ANME-2 cluster archaeon]
MTLVKDAPRTSTSFIIRSDANTRVTASRDPFYELMRRLFQDESTAIRGQSFLEMILEREASGNPIRTSEWAELLRKLGVSRSSFYAGVGQTARFRNDHEQEKGLPDIRAV